MREPERESADAAPVTTPSLDLLFDVLANRRRRYALYYLQGVDDGVATIDEVADHVVSLERSEDGTVSDGYTGVLTSLRHVHVPKLEDAGVVEYDHRSETIRYWEQPSFEELIEHARHKEL